MLFSKIKGGRYIIYYQGGNVTNTTKAKRHHIVPQFILKQFSDKKGFVHVYEKSTGKDFKSKIGNVLFTNNQYNFHIKNLKSSKIDEYFQQTTPELASIIQKIKNEAGEKINLEDATKVAKETINGLYISIEGRLSHIESKSSEVIKKIIKDDSIANLSEEEIIQLQTFVVVQYLRGDDGIRLINDSAKRIMNIFPNHKIDDYSEEMTRLQVYGIMMPKQIVELGAILVHTTQPYIIKADSNKNFCISDHPVPLCNKNKFGPYGNLGFALPGIERDIYAHFPQIYYCIH